MDSIAFMGISLAVFLLAALGATVYYLWDHSPVGSLMSAGVFSLLAALALFVCRVGGQLDYYAAYYRNQTQALAEGEVRPMAPPESNVWALLPKWVPVVAVAIGAVFIIAALIVKAVEFLKRNVRSDEGVQYSIGAGKKYWTPTKDVKVPKRTATRGNVTSMQAHRAPSGTDGM